MPFVYSYVHCHMVGQKNLSACIRDFFYWTPHSISTTPQATTVVAVLTDFMQIKKYLHGRSYMSYKADQIKLKERINSWIGLTCPCTRINCVPLAKCKPVKY